MSKKIDVAVFTGSKSDLPTLKSLGETLDKLGIGYELKITSAHRTPEQTKRFIEYYDKELNVSAFICAAGYAAHLAGVVAAETIKPVIGIPVNSCIKKSNFRNCFPGICIFYIISSDGPACV